MEVHTFVDHFESALQFIIEQPEKLVGEVELINDREMRFISSETLTNGEINPTDKNDSPSNNDSSSVRNMVDLIKLQVDRTPQKVAASEVLLIPIHYNDFFPASIWPRCVFDLRTDGLPVKLFNSKTDFSWC